MREDFGIIDEILEEMQDLLEDPTYVREVLRDMRNLMVKKGQDYSGDAHTWSNFEEAALVSKQDFEAIFLSLLGTKFARLAALLLEAKPFTPPVKGWRGWLGWWDRTLRGHRVPNNESIEDSWKDLACYVVLTLGYLRWTRGYIPKELG